MVSTGSDLTPAGRLVLLGSVFVVASCGLVYELVAGAVSSYLLGDAVTQFSLVIGVFLCALGVGAYIAKFISRDLLRIFVEIEIWIGLAGGMSSILMFAVSAFVHDLFPVFFYALCATIGIMVGVEIPLLMRILSEGRSIKEALSHVLALDYAGALLGSILFPLIALPYLGLSRSSVVFGLMNLAVAYAGLRLLREKTGPMMLRLFAVTLVLVGSLFSSSRLVGFLEDLLYQDSIIYTANTPYQRIVLTRWRDDVRLYLNGQIQFSSIDEARYHEALVIPAMEGCGHVSEVLILGGGDGMAAREVLKYEKVKRAVVCDLDPEMTRLGKERKEILALNRGALNADKVFVVNQDAMRYVLESKDFFDVVIIDLPDPSNQALAKLYSDSFYTLCLRRLRPGGVVVTQATSPFFAPDAFWCVVRTMEEASSRLSEAGPFHVLPYHLNVPSFGEWGFVLCSSNRIDPLGLRPSVPARYMNAESLHAMFGFSLDMTRRQEVLVNRLDNPILYMYYKAGWRTFSG